MFPINSSEIDLALVAEHQATLRHDARRARFTRQSLRSGRVRRFARGWLAELNSPPPPIPRVGEYLHR